MEETCVENLWNMCFIPILRRFSNPCKAPSHKLDPSSHHTAALESSGSFIWKAEAVLLCNTFKKFENKTRLAWLQKTQHKQQKDKIKIKIKDIISPLFGFTITKTKEKWITEVTEFQLMDHCTLINMQNIFFFDDVDYKIMNNVPHSFSEMQMIMSLCLGKSQKHCVYN